MKLIPLDDRVVIKLVEAEGKTPGGIVLPDMAKEKPVKGIVVEVGPGKLTDSGGRLVPTVEVGDMVMFARYAGSEIEVGGEEYSVMRESDILGVLK